MARYVSNGFTAGPSGGKAASAFGDPRGSTVKALKSGKGGSTKKRGKSK